MASAIRLNWDAALAVARRDLQIFASYRLRFISQVLSMVFGVLLFYYVSRLVTAAQFPSHNAYFAYVVIGLAVMEFLTATMHTVPTTLRSEMLAGTFERIVVSPFGPLGGIVAMSLFPLLLASAMGVLTIGAAVVLFGLPLHWATVPLVLPVGVLGMLAFLPLALLLASAVLIVKQAGNIATFLISGLSLAGGSFFPVSVLPSSLRWISDVQPLTPALQLTRHVLVGTPLTGSALAATLKLAGFAIVLTPLALLALQSALRTCRVRGTLIEY